jgi:hypothetical protein
MACQPNIYLLKPLFQDCFELEEELAVRACVFDVHEA